MFEFIQELNEGTGAVSGQYNPQEVEALYKAMQAGQVTGAQTWDSTSASGAPLKVESLENTLKVLTAKPKHAPFFSSITKKPATNTIEEYVQLVSYGNFDGGFTIEGELPEMSDSVYRRKAQHVKYLGLVGGVTLPMQLVNTGAGIADVMAQEVKNKVMAMTLMMEHALPFADSRVVPENFNGLFSQHETEGPMSGNYNQYMTSEFVIDCKGKILTDDVVEQASQTIVNNYGLGDLLVSHPGVFGNYNKRYYQSKFIRPIPEDVRNGVFGQRVNEIWTQNGGVGIMQSNFWRLGGAVKLSTDTATSTKAPNAPTASTAAVVATDSLSKFSATDVGDYRYLVTAKNRYGESAPIAVSSGNLISATSGCAIDISTTVATGFYSATGFCVYRSEKDPGGTLADTKFYKVFEVGVDQRANGYDGGAANVIRDRNRFIANTDQAMLIENDGEQVYSLKQLAPLMNLRLAVTSPTNRFMVLLYSTPILYAPQKMVRIVNIGKEMV